MCKVEMEKEDVCHVVRLGKRKENGEPRPMLVTLSGEKVKRSIMRNLYKLKDGPENFRKIKMTMICLPQREKNQRNCLKSVKNFKMKTNRETGCTESEVPPGTGR